MKQVSRRGLTVVGSVVLIGVLASGWQQVNAARKERAEARLRTQRSAFAPTDTVEMGRMPAELRESSGVTISRRYPGVFWTHNDSGDEPRVYAIDATARLVATFEVEGARARDWEAMELGPCPGSGTSCLYLADIGDNLAGRNSVAIYIIEEPDPSAGDGEVALLGAVRFVYPDGPHNAEALAITAEGNLVVVTKERSLTTWFFEIPAADVADAALIGGFTTAAAYLGHGMGDMDPSLQSICTDPDSSNLPLIASLKIAWRILRNKL